MDEPIALDRIVCGTCFHWLGKRQAAQEAGLIIILSRRGCCRVCEDTRDHIDVCVRYAPHRPADEADWKEIPLPKRP